VQCHRLNDSVKAIDVPWDQPRRAPARSPTGSHNEAAPAMEMTRRRGYRQVGRRPPAFSLTPLLSQSVTLGHAPPPTPSWPRSSLAARLPIVPVAIADMNPVRGACPIHGPARQPDCSDWTCCRLAVTLWQRVVPWNMFAAGSPDTPRLPTEVLRPTSKEPAACCVHPLTCTVAVADTRSRCAMAADDPPDRTTARGFIMPVVTMAPTAPRLWRCTGTRHPGTPPQRRVRARIFRARTCTLCLQMNSPDPR